MRIIGLQWDLAWENKGANFAHARRLLGTAAPPRGSLVVLPEMFATGFSMNVPAIAEDQHGETSAFLSALAHDHGVHVVGGLVARAEDGRGRNEAVCFDPGGAEIARYCKMHPFRPAGEREHYCEGSDPVVFRWDDLTVSPFICYDLRFPEIFRIAVMKGAGLFVVIANWPSPRAAHWRTLLQARAIENQAFVIGVNRCGRDPNLAYSGGTIVVGPDGKIIGELSDGEGVLEVEIDPDELRSYRAKLPFLQDLRRDLLRPSRGSHSVRPSEPRS